MKNQAPIINPTLISLGTNIGVTPTWRHVAGRDWKGSLIRFSAYETLRRSVTGGFGLPVTTRS